MQKPAAIVIALSLITQATATPLIITSATQSISVSGARPGAQYAQSTTQTTVSGFSGSISGEAVEAVSDEGTDVLLKSKSSASLDSSFTGNSISISGEVYASDDELWYQSPRGYANAGLYVQIGFSLSEASVVSLSGQRFLFFSGYPDPSNWNFSVSDSGGTEILGDIDLLGGATQLFGAGDYFLLIGTHYQGSGDPLGSLGFSTFKADLSVTRVPDSGATTALLAMALIGLIVGERVRRGYAKARALRNGPTSAVR